MKNAPGGVDRLLWGMKNVYKNVREIVPIVSEKFKDPKTGQQQKKIHQFITRSTPHYFLQAATNESF